MKWYPHGHDFGNVEIGGITFFEQGTTSRSVPTFATIDTQALRGSSIDTSTLLVFLVQTEAILLCHWRSGFGAVYRTVDRAWLYSALRQLLPCPWLTRRYRLSSSRCRIWLVHGHEPACRNLYQKSDHTYFESVEKAAVSTKIQPIFYVMFTAL
jgi:hypothetical protein